MADSASSRDGDFDAFYRAHEPGVRRLAARLVGSDEAEDLTQEVMLRADRQLQSDGFDGSSWPWLVTVTRRLAIDHYRRTARISLADDTRLEELAGPVEDAPVAAAIRADVRHRLSLALGRLPPDDRALLTRHEVDGATVVSMAGALGVSANALRQRLFRVRRSLSRHYQQLGGAEYALPAVEGSKDRLSILRPDGHPTVSRIAGRLAEIAGTVPPGSRRATAALAAALAVVTAPGPPPRTAGVPPQPELPPFTLPHSDLLPPLSPPVPVAPHLVSLPGQVVGGLPAAVPGPGSLRVEAESGDIPDPLCGDAGQTMAAFPDPSASGGQAVFYTATGCRQSFSTRDERRVHGVRLRVNGRDGEICGHVAISGAITGRSEEVCEAAGTWLSVAVTSTSGTGDYAVTWVVGKGQESWLDVSVDHHTLVPPGHPAGQPASQCGDGVDNDGDGTVDAGDPGCGSGIDDDQEASVGACDDGIDNDGDGVRDYGKDGGCGTWADPTEDCRLVHVEPAGPRLAGECWDHPDDASVSPPPLKAPPSYSRPT